MRRLIAALLLVAIGGAGRLAGQGPEGIAGGISGEVRLPNGRPVARATVVLTGPPPALRRVATTDVAGLFHFVALRDGVYTVETAHPLTSTAIAERLRLRAGELLFVRLTVEPDAPSKLTISAQPLLDITTPSRPRSQDTPHLLVLPGDRTHDTSLPRIAGVEEDRQVAVSDGAPLAVQGLSVSEVDLVVDGNDATDARTGLPIQRIPLELVETQQVAGPARSADSRSAAGAGVAVLTRRPGTEWHGGATLLFTDDRLQARPRTPPATGSPPATPSELVDAGLWSTGPLATNRAWISVGLVPQRGESPSVDLKRLPASGQLELRPASSLQLHGAASFDRTEGPFGGESALFAPGPDPLDGRETHESLATGLLVDWIAGPRLTIHAALRELDFERRVRGGPLDGLLEDERQHRTAARADVALFLPGPRLHALGLGAEWTDSRTEIDASRSLAPGTVAGETLSLHLRDTMQLSRRVSLDLGLRAEDHRSERLGSPQSLSFELDETFAPRLGLAWDVRGDGQSKAYGQVAWLVPPLLHQLPLDAFAPPLSAEVDPELEPPRALAAALGIDHRLLPTVRLGAELSWHRQLEAVSLLRLATGEAGSSTTSVVANPGSGLATYPYGPSLPAHPGLERTYVALTLGAQARFPRWSGYVSYVFSDLEGTWNGLANPDDPTAPISPYTGDTCSTLEGCFTAAGHVSRGPLALDRPHRVKLSGHLRLRERLTLGGFLRVESGTPFSRQVPVVTVEEGSAVLTRLFQPEGRGDEGRLPTRTQADLRLQYEVPLRGGEHRLVIVADLRNAFDEQTVVERWPRAYLDPLHVARGAFFDGFDPDALAAAQGIGADPRFGAGLRFAPPRRLRIGLRWQW